MTLDDLRAFSRRRSLLEQELDSVRTALEAMGVAYRTVVQRSELERKLVDDGDRVICELLDRCKLLEGRILELEARA